MTTIANFVKKLASRHWWTAADYEDLPGELRFEIYGGGLRVMPAGSPGHQVMCAEIVEMLRGSIPNRRLVVQAVDVRAEDEIFLPDVIVTREVVEQLPVPATSVDLVVEVVERENIERTTKMRAYAAAGIPAYIVVDGEQGQRVAEIYGLSEGKYVRAALAAFDARLTLNEPFRFSIDMRKINY
jgi:Uma2 family endonuclease